MNTDTLIPPRLHRSRYTPDYIMYTIIEGELYLEESGKEIKLSAGDVYIFKKGDYHKPLKSTYCRYYYTHFETNYFKEYEMTDDEYYQAVTKNKIGFINSNKYSSNCYDFMKVLLRQKNKIQNKGFFNYFVNILENNGYSPDFV